MCSRKPQTGSEWLIRQAANGFTSLPMVARDGLPDAPARDASVALYDWLQLA